MIDVKKIADAADVIVNGYAFTKAGKVIKVLNLNRPDSATVLSIKGEVLETSMDDIELKIISDYFKRNFKFLED
jgi:hypothetical protein